ncbi:MAG: FAD-binding protein [Caldicoprobacterales bacterium]|jgi:succinate dehydrogenase/fumarate reductase flavoprotein subunit|nr:FAD-binding protein [Clostridiales bacterium]
MKIQYRTDTDVLVIGMGGAGIKASIKAAEIGAKVLLVGKYAFGRTGATFYPGTPGWGMQAILHRGDSEQQFFEEIIEAGAGAADPKLARILAEKSTHAFHELESYGIHFEKYEDGSYKGVIPCFGKRLRGSTTLGLNRIRRALWLQLNKRRVNIRHGISVISLVKKNDAVCGALALDEQNELFYIASRAVVLATGGACGLYKYSLSTPDQTGDGYMLAFNAGASLINMEFIQFIPGLVWPVKKKLFQEKNLDTFPKITNIHGEDIVRKYLPQKYTVEECLTERAKHGPFTTADISFYLDVGMYEEAIKGNAMQSGGIHMQYDGKVLEDDRWFIKSWVEWMETMGVKPVEEGFDIIPHAQCFNGGIAIDENTSTGVPGLYAAGEAAGGVHGADRLGGAAIAATQVFGAIAGEQSATYARKSNFTEVTDNELIQCFAERFSCDEGGITDIPNALKEIRKIMWECGAIVRSEKRCADGFARITQIESTFNPIHHFEQRIDIRKISELVSSIQLAKILLGVMNERRESRGPHYRSDFPDQVSKFNGRVSVQKGSDCPVYRLMK